MWIDICTVMIEKHNNTCSVLTVVFFFSFFSGDPVNAFDMMVHEVLLVNMCRCTMFVFKDPPHWWLSHIILVHLFTASPCFFSGLYAWPEFIGSLERVKQMRYLGLQTFKSVLLFVHVYVHRYVMSPPLTWSCLPGSSIATSAEGVCAVNWLL